jgi:uncharacterized protein (TIGR03435 family)
MLASRTFRITLALAVPSILTSQEAAIPMFDVASIKPAEHAALFKGNEPGRFYESWTKLFYLVRMAYGVNNYQVVAPAWMYPDKNPQNYEVDARYPAGVGKDKVPEMLQNLLADRFGLQAHQKTRPVAVYALVAGPAPPKLKKSQIPVDADGKPVPGFSVSSSARGFGLRRATIQVFAGQLEQYVGRPVIDMTGIEGKYDFSMRFDRELFASDSKEPPAGSIFAVVHDLGFRLEKRDVPMKIIVVDHAEKTPIPN